MVLYIVATIIFQSDRAGAQSLPLRRHAARAAVRHERRRHLLAAAWWFRLYWGAFVDPAAGRRASAVAARNRDPAEAAAAAAPARLRGTPGADRRLPPLLVADRRPAAGSSTTPTSSTNIAPSDDGEQFLAEYERRFLRFEACRSRRSAMSCSTSISIPSEIRADVSGSYRLTNLTGAPISDGPCPQRRTGQLEAARGRFPGRAAGRATTRNSTIASTGSTGRWRRAKLATWPSDGRRQQVGFRNSRRRHAAGRPTAPSSTISSWRRRSAWAAIGLLQERDRAAQIRPAARASAGAARGPAATAQHLFRRRLVDRRHHHLDQSPTRRRSRRAARFPTCPRRPADRALRLRRADPDLLLDPVGPLCRGAAHASTASTSRSITIRPTTGTSTGCSTRCRRRSIIIRPRSGPISSTRRGSSNFPATRPSPRPSPTPCPIRNRSASPPTISDPDEIDYVTYVTAHELGHQWWAHQVIGADMQGGTMLSRDARPIFGADGDEAALRRGQDPPLPPVRARQLSAQPRRRGDRGAAARPGREPALHPLPQGLAGHVSAAGADRRGGGQPRAAAAARALPVPGRALSALARPDPRCCAPRRRRRSSRR